eukprot:Sdes_comp20642_c0_seq1m15827
MTSPLYLILFVLLNCLLLSDSAFQGRHHGGRRHNHHINPAMYDVDDPKIYKVSLQVSYPSTTLSFPIKQKLFGKLKKMVHVNNRRNFYVFVLESHDPALPQEKISQLTLSVNPANCKFMRFSAGFREGFQLDGAWNAFNWVTPQEAYNRNDYCEAIHTFYRESMEPVQVKFKFYKRTYSSDPAMGWGNQIARNFGSIFY